MVNRGQFGNAADRYAPAPTVACGLPANFVEMHPGRIEIKIEMKVYVAVITSTEIEYARDLAARIAVCIGAPTMLSLVSGETGC